MSTFPNCLVPNPCNHRPRCQPQIPVAVPQLLQERKGIHLKLHSQPLAAWQASNCPKLLIAHPGHALLTHRWMQEGGQQDERRRQQQQQQQQQQPKRGQQLPQGVWQQQDASLGLLPPAAALSS